MASATRAAYTRDRLPTPVTWVAMTTLLPSGGTFARLVEEAVTGTLRNGVWKRCGEVAAIRIRQGPQVARYGRSGRNSCHSCAVRLRPATRQAIVSQSEGSTSQAHPEPVSETTKARRPSGVKYAASQLSFG